MPIRNLVSLPNSVAPAAIWSKGACAPLELGIVSPSYLLRLRVFLLRFVRRKPGAKLGRSSALRPSRRAPCFPHHPRKARRKRTVDALLARSQRTRLRFVPSPSVPIAPCPFFPRPKPYPDS